MTIRNQFTDRPDTLDGEKGFQPSKTQPDQSMTVRELLERNRRGLPLSGKLNPIYYGDDQVLPDLKKMDLSEIAALRDGVQEQIDEYRRDLKAQQDKVAAAEVERQKLVQFEEWKQRDIAKKTQTTEPQKL